MSENVSQFMRKTSFDRFGDDLIELVLSYISFEDSFQYKCVSKQWKRLVFNKQNKLIISDYSKINFINDSNNEFNIKTIELILKNCQNITSIRFSYGFEYESVVNIDSVFDLIINYCNHLSEIDFNFEIKDLSQNTIKTFGEKFGSNIKKISFDKISDNNKEILLSYLVYLF